MEHLDTLLVYRVRHLIPLKSLLQAGVLLGNGSDAPCTLPDPLHGIHAACNHPNPNESIDVLDALRMHTHWAAKLSFDEGNRGTLSIEKAADFVVLSENPLQTPKERIKDIRVTDLYLGGKKYKPPSQSILLLLARVVRSWWQH